MSRKPIINESLLVYFPIQKHWKRLGPLFKSKEATRIWTANMIEYGQQRALNNRYKFTYTKYSYALPRDYDSCDWRCCGSGVNRGPRPAFWDYVCHSACHWLVDLCLHVASQAYPKIPWRIVSSRQHSTVWNGDCENPVLFDTNFLALDVSVKEAWSLAVLKGRILKPGQRLRYWVKIK